MNFYNNELGEPDTIQPGEEANEDGLNEHLNWGIPRQIFSDPLQSPPTKHIVK